MQAEWFQGRGLHMNHHGNGRKLCIYLHTKCHIHSLTEDYKLKCTFIAGNVVKINVNAETILIVYSAAFLNWTR